MGAKRNSTTLLFDADVYAYQAASAVERTMTFDGSNYIRTGSVDQAFKSFQERIETYLKYFNTNKYILAFSDSSANGFRKDILPSYKANRDPSTRPTALQGLKDYIMEEYDNVWTRPRLEADDVLGILATSDELITNTRKVIVSIDKDFLSVPCLYFNSKDMKMYRTSKDRAAYHHCHQMLTGDTVDGYKGCPSFGPKTTDKLLAPHKDEGGYEKLWVLVLGAYEKKGLTKEDALVQARVSRILQVQDYNYEKEEVILWEPPEI